MRRIPNSEVLLLLALTLLSGCAVRSLHKQQNVPAVVVTASPYLDESANAIQRLQAWYAPATGLYESTGWWNSANGMTVLVDYVKVSKSAQYNSEFANTFIAAQNTSPKFLNKYYDDEGWWALAWIDAYDVTRNPQYLSMAKLIFADMAGGWDDVCGGGIWWSKDRQYKNAIANELFLSVAAHLVNRTSRTEQKQFLDWGDKEWKWFQASGMINSKSLVNDGLGKSPGQVSGVGCTNNGRTTWSYNQGVILGGLAELSAVNHDPSLPETAKKIATAAMTLLVDDNGILHDSCEPHCGADGVQFKGIFVRNLVLLDRMYPQSIYKSFVYRNADAIWKDAQGRDFELGQVWSGPFEAGGAGSQISALDAMVGAATLKQIEIKKSRGIQ
jgi:predicted alpha-1,6-mannanase (GH76 family)